MCMSHGSWNCLWLWQWLPLDPEGRLNLALEDRRSTLVQGQHCLWHTPGMIQWVYLRWSQLGMWSQDSDYLIKYKWMQKTDFSIEQLQTLPWRVRGVSFPTRPLVDIYQCAGQDIFFSSNFPNRISVPGGPWYFISFYFIYLFKHGCLPQPADCSSVGPCINIKTYNIKITYIQHNST